MSPIVAKHLADAKKSLDKVQEMVDKGHWLTHVEIKQLAQLQQALTGTSVEVVKRKDQKVRLTSIRTQLMVAAREAGYKQFEIAEMFSMSSGRVSQILSIYDKSV